MKLGIQAKAAKNQCAFYLLEDANKLELAQLSKEEQAYVAKRKKAGDNYILINRFTHLVIIQLTAEWNKKTAAEQKEARRQCGAKAATALNTHGYNAIWLAQAPGYLDVAEGLMLANYQYNRFKSEKKRKCAKRSICSRTKK